MNAKSDRDPPAWKVIVVGIGFLIAFLVWAVAFDAVAGWMRGHWIEDILNVVTSPWPWIALIVVYGVFYTLMNRGTGVKDTPSLEDLVRREDRNEQDARTPKPWHE